MSLCGRLSTAAEQANQGAQSSRAPKDQPRTILKLLLQTGGDAFRGSRVQLIRMNHPVID